MLSRDQFALVAASQFNLFSHYANSVYWRAITAPAGAPVNARTIARDMLGGATQLMNGLTPLMDDHVSALCAGDERVATSLMDDIIRAHDGINHVLLSVSRQVQDAWRAHKLREGLHGMPSLGLRYHDTIGRSYAAEDTVRLLLRGFAVNTHVTERLERLKEQGFKRVHLEYPDPDHERQGMTLDIEQSAIWREVYFHPNTNAMVVGHD